MRRFLLTIVFSIMATCTTRPAFAQTVHSDTLTWSFAAGVTNPPGTTYNVYQAPGLCSGNPTFTQVATGVTALTYLVTPLAPGNYCWYVTSVFGGSESKPSPTTQATIGPFAPSVLNNVPAP